MTEHVCRMGTEHKQLDVEPEEVTPFPYVITSENIRNLIGAVLHVEEAERAYAIADALWTAHEIGRHNGTRDALEIIRCATGPKILE